MMPSSIQGLILDYGEVLVRAQPPGAPERMASIAGLPLAEFTARYWRHRDAYDAGLPAAEYWARVLGEPRGGTAQVEQLIEADVASWTSYRDEVWEIAAAFRAAGGRTAMLSNGVPEIIGRVRRERPLDRYFDLVVVSCEVGCSKPDPAIYRLCVERLGVAAPAALFVDDRPVNLRAAEAEGLQTLHFTGDGTVPALRQALAKQPEGRPA